MGTVYISHGCAHAASNYWPKSADCPECEGLPEELSHVWQALKKGYAGGWVGGRAGGQAAPWSVARVAACAWQRCCRCCRPTCAAAAPLLYAAAVLAVSSLDRATGCWSWGADDQDVAAIINEFLADNGWVGGEGGSGGARGALRTVSRGNARAAVGCSLAHHLADCSEQSAWAAACCGGAISWTLGACS